LCMAFLERYLDGGRPVRDPMFRISE